MKTVGPGWREMYFCLKAVREMNLGAYPSFSLIEITPSYVCLPTSVSVLETSTPSIIFGSIGKAEIFGTGKPSTIRSTFWLCGSVWYITSMASESVVWARQPNDSNEKAHNKVGSFMAFL